MYYQDDREQLSIEEFFQPFGGRLRKDNRWVRLAAIMPWEYIEKVYIQNLSGETGRPAISSRIAFGAIFIKEFSHFTDEGTVQELQENSYMQYFVGLHEFYPEPLFDPSKALPRGRSGKDQRICLHREVARRTEERRSER